MQDYQQRVIAERDELETRIFRLRLFLEHSDAFKALDIQNQGLLNSQLEAMEEYSSILTQRIELFTD